MVAIKVDIYKDNEPDHVILIEQMEDSIEYTVTHNQKTLPYTFLHQPTDNSIDLVYAALEIIE